MVLLNVLVQKKQRMSLKMNKYKIKPEERGHRKPLSDEPTVSYTIKMPLSLKQKCIKIGSNMVRKILKDWAKKDQYGNGFYNI